MDEHFPFLTSSCGSTQEKWVQSNRKLHQKLWCMERDQASEEYTRYSSQKRFSCQDRTRDGVLRLERHWVCWYYSRHVIYKCTNIYICILVRARASIWSWLASVTESCVKKEKLYYVSHSLRRLGGIGCPMLSSLSSVTLSFCDGSTRGHHCQQVQRDVAAIPTSHSTLPRGTGGSTRCLAHSPGAVASLPTLQGMLCQVGDSQHCVAQSFLIRGWQQHRYQFQGEV